MIATPIASASPKLVNWCGAAKLRAARSGVPRPAAFDNGLAFDVFEHGEKVADGALRP
jgi:hypothetical protein